MNVAALTRHVAIHRAFADAIEGHFRRLWRRDLSAHEVNTIQSSTLCCSFMSLESLDRGLSFATSSAKADEIFEFISSEVVRHSSSVIEEIRKQIEIPVDLQDPSQFDNLLVWEIALLARRNQTA